MQEGRRHKLWAVLNVLGFTATVVMNGLANALPLNGKGTGEISDAYPNLFVPAGLTFSIWGLIYLLLAALVTFQVASALRGVGGRAALDRVGPWFGVSCVANSLWIVAWHWQHVGLALLLMLLLLGSLIAMYLRLGIGRAEKPWTRRVLVELPVSVYLGWITVATIANVTALLVDVGLGELAPGPVFWTVVMMLAAVLIAARVLFKRADLAFAAVVLWALLGIFIKRRALALPTDDAVELAAVAGMLLLALAGAVQLLHARREHRARIVSA